jgi:hypothetical protein
MTSKFIAVVIPALLTLTGCEAAKPPAQPVLQASVESKREPEGLAKLSEEDRALALTQKYCAVTGEPLGSMGAPIKLMIEDQPVFICCEGCEEPAKEDPKATLASVAELKTKAAAEAAK